MTRVRTRVDEATESGIYTGLPHKVRKKLHGGWKHHSYRGSKNTPAEVNRGGTAPFRFLETWVLTTARRTASRCGHWAHTHVPRASESVTGAGSGRVYCACAAHTRAHCSVLGEPQFVMKLHHASAVLLLVAGLSSVYGAVSQFLEPFNNHVGLLQKEIYKKYTSRHIATTGGGGVGLEKFRWYAAQAIAQFKV